MTPGVSILYSLSASCDDSRQIHSRLTLEVFHDVEKAIVDIGHVTESDLDLIEVAESVLSTRD
jgi:hypothetical protein